MEAYAVSGETVDFGLFTGAIGVCFGYLLGAAMEAWNWRMSGESHHRNHKSAGRWYYIEPAAEFYKRQQREAGL